MRTVIAILMLLCCGVASAQSSPAPPDRPFTLLMISHTGGVANSDAVEQQIRQMVFQPRTQAMQRWLQWASPKVLSAQSPTTIEHHADILRDAQSLPAVALVDSTTGARWHLVSRPDLAKGEAELARQLDVYFAATMEAAKQMPQNAVRTVPKYQYDINRNAAYRFPNAARGGPQPYMPPTDGLLPKFPDINIPAIPDSFDAGINATVDSETRNWATWIVVACLIAFIIGCCVLIGIVWMVCEAFTNNPDRTNES